MEKRHVFSISLRGANAEYLLDLKRKDCTNLSAYLGRIVEAHITRIREQKQK